MRSLGLNATSAWPLLNADEEAATTTTDVAANLSTSISDRGIALPVQSQVVLIVLYTATTFLSIIGNIVVIIVFTAGRRSRTDLRWFLINLAASDLIMAIFCMPFTFTMAMTGHWVFTAPMCPIVLYLQTVSVSASVFTNTAIGIDRFWVVGFPLKSRLMTRSRRSSVVIATVWVAALALSSVQLIVGRSTTYQGPEGVEVMDCMEVWPEPSAVWRRAYTFFLLATTYALPFAVLLMTYVFVCQRLWRRTTPGNADEARDLQQLNSKRKVIKMLIVVVTLFGVCWLPLHAFFIVIDFHPELVDPEAPQHRAIFVALYYGVHWLAMSNSFVNPLIYGLFNDSFRHDLKWLLLKCIPCASTSHRPCFPAASFRSKPDPGLSTPTSLAMKYRQESRRWLEAEVESSFPVATSLGQFHAPGSALIVFGTARPEVDN